MISNINKKLSYINKLIKQNSTKIYIYFATKMAGDDFDPYEQNYTYTNLNPVTIKGYVRQITPEALVWKQYGLREMGAKEIICDKRYRNWFEKCNKIEINGEKFQVFKEGTGNRCIIQERPFNLIRVVINKVE